MASLSIYEIAASLVTEKDKHTLRKIVFEELINVAKDSDCQNSVRLETESGLTIGEYTEDCIIHVPNHHGKFFSTISSRSGSSASFIANIMGIDNALMANIKALNDFNFDHFKKKCFDPNNHVVNGQGKIKFSRMDGNMKLFDSCYGNQTCIGINLIPAIHNKDKDSSFDDIMSEVHFSYSGSPVMEVRLSSDQFSRFVQSNSSYIPCTIKISGNNLINLEDVQEQKIELNYEENLAEAQRLMTGVREIADRISKKYSFPEKKIDKNTKQVTPAFLKTIDKKVTPQVIEDLKNDLEKLRQAYMSVRPSVFSLNRQTIESVDSIEEARLRRELDMEIQKLPPEYHDAVRLLLPKF